MKRIISLLTIIIIVLTILPHASADLNDGLVAYWPFSGDANDASGNGHHGTVVGPTLAVDRFGNAANAYSFDGVNDYIDIPYSSSIEPSVFSFSIWFKSSSSNQGVLLSSDPNSYWCNHGYTIYLHGHNFYPPGPVAPYGTPIFSIDALPTCGRSGKFILGNSPLNDGEWHHMVAIYNGSSMKMYVNGVLQGGPEVTGYSKTRASIRIGMKKRTINHPEWRWFYKGSIDDIRLYNRVLTNSEILDLFHESCSFVDVPPDHWAGDAICAIYDEGITTGCSTNPLKYCPLRDVNRAQMAIFLERGINDGDYTPPPATGEIFDDVPVTHWAADWIEQFYKDGITTGCAKNPLKYCPDRAVNRAQMAVFLLRSKYDSNYTPPPPEGIFKDVPKEHWAAAWIEQLYKEGITTGCSTDPLKYCPLKVVNRAQMAVFLIRTFGL